MSRVDPTAQRERIAALLQMLKAEGVSKFKGLGIEVEFDPRSGGVPMPTSLFDEAVEELDDAIQGEAKENFKRAQRHKDEDLFWST